MWECIEHITWGRGCKGLTFAQTGGNWKKDKKFSSSSTFTLWCYQMESVGVSLTFSIFWFIRLWKKRHWISLLRKCGQFVETRPFCAECRLATDSHFKVPSRFLYIQFLSKHHSNTGNSWLIWMFLFFNPLSTEMVRRFNVSVICFIIFFQDFIYLPGSIAIWVKSGADPHPLPFIRSAPLSLLLLFTRLFFISTVSTKKKQCDCRKFRGFLCSLCLQKCGEGIEWLADSMVKISYCCLFNSTKNHLISI